MMILKTTGQFRKDCKQAKKRGLDIALLDKLLQTLLDGKKLASKYRDHALTGDYKGFRECHITSDWLLISCR